MSHVVCLMDVKEDRATFTWSEGPASFEPYTLDGMVYKDFKEIAAEARERLADLVKDYLSDEQRMPASAFAVLRRATNNTAASAEANPEKV